MSLPTNFPDDWWLVKSDPKDNLTKLTDSETGELLKIMKQSVWTVQLVRNLYKVTAFQDQMGQKRSSFNAKTGPQTSVNIAWTGKQFVCTADTLTLIDPTTGQYQEEQTWVHYGKPVEVNPNEFGSWRRFLAYPALNTSCHVAGVSRGFAGAIAHPHSRGMSLKFPPAPETA